MFAGDSADGGRAVPLSAAGGGKARSPRPLDQKRPGDRSLGTSIRRTRFSRSKMPRELKQMRGQRYPKPGGRGKKQIQPSRVVLEQTPFLSFPGREGSSAPRHQLESFLLATPRGMTRILRTNFRACAGAHLQPSCRSERSLWSGRKGTLRVGVRGLVGEIHRRSHPLRGLPVAVRAMPRINSSRRVTVSFCNTPDASYPSFGSPS